MQVSGNGVYPGRWRAPYLLGYTERVSLYIILCIEVARDSLSRVTKMLERIGSDSNLGLRVTGGLTFGAKPGAIDKV